jgi:hypothetical protein
MRSTQFIFFLALPLLGIACSSSDDSAGGHGGSGGASGSAAGGKAGTAGAGASGGKGGAGGGSAGTGATAGTGNVAGSETGGNAGEAGASPMGEAGMAGEGPSARLDLPDFAGVPEPVKAIAGVPGDTVLSPTLTATAVARGVMNVENPADAHLKGATGGDSVQVTKYGYWGDNADLTLATKSEPDKNTYLLLNGQKGPSAGFDYGTHFLFQGHENGPAITGGPLTAIANPGATSITSGYITRVNLDVPLTDAHRVTLYAATDKDQNPLPLLDGSTYDPFANKLIFSNEDFPGGLWQASLADTWPPVVENLFAAMGNGGFEGVQVDSAGNLFIVEDIGGKVGTTNPHAKQPNSFVYRFVPKAKGDLTKGKLQALQVTSLQAGNAPIVFHAGQMDADATSADIKELHSYGKQFTTQWVTVHDTDVDTSGATFDANAAAKTAGATPFKRPENGVFRPGSAFTEFYFTETGDTTVLTEVGATAGGFGGVYKLKFATAGADTGTLSLLYLSDIAHTGFDNIAFWSDRYLAVVEDAGDTLHKQRDALDSAYLFDLSLDYSKPQNQPKRFIAEGRDPSATVSGDNEITGIHISDGDATSAGLLGANVPQPFMGGWRVFWTQQHGDNVTWELGRTLP